MNDPDLATIAREARRRRRLPAGAVCAECGTDRQLSARPGGRILCYLHVREEGGAGPTELDHLAGRRNLGGLLVQLRANDHRSVTELRIRLGIDDWPDAAGDPLVALAHLLAGIATLLFLVAEWLVAVAADLAQRLGPTGWEGVALAPVVQ